MKLNPIRRIEREKREPVYEHTDHRYAERQADRVVQDWHACPPEWRRVFFDGLGTSAKVRLLVKRLVSTSWYLDRVYLSDRTFVCPRAPKPRTQELAV